MTLTENPAPAKSRRNRRRRHPVASFFHSIYRLLYNKVLGVIVILAMAVAVLIGTIVMQMPAGLADDPAARGRWLETVRPRYGGWTDIFDAIGFFTLWTSPVFLFITLWLSASIIACTTHRLPNLVQQTLHPRVNVSARFFERAQYRAEIPVESTSHDALGAVRTYLLDHRFRVVDGDDGSSLYSDKFRWGPWGTVAAHVSFVIIIAAFVVSAAFSLDEQMDIAIGDRVELGHGTGIEIEAVTFSDTYDEMGRPLDYVSDLIAYQDGQQVARQDVRVNTPLIVDGVSFHQASFGIAASMLVTDETGTIHHGAVPLKFQDDDRRFSIGKLVIQDRNLELIVVTPASGRVDDSIPAGSAMLELYDIVTDEQLGVMLVDQGEAVTIAGTTFTFERERQYTGILVRKDPGAPLMWIGSILLIGGMSVTFGFRPRRLWARVDETDGHTAVRLAMAEKPNILFETQFRGMAEQIETASHAGKEAR